MPTEHSRGSDSEYTDDAERMLKTKNNETIVSLIRGMQDVDRVNRWIRIEANGQARKKLIGRLNRRKKAIKQSNGK